jgi:hypothetical protein
MDCERRAASTASLTERQTVELAAVTLADPGRQLAKPAEPWLVLYGYPDGSRLLMAFGDLPREELRELDILTQLVGVRFRVQYGRYGDVISDAELRAPSVGR